MSFEFPRDVIGSFGPAFSNDGGNTWNWLYDELHQTHDQFTYTFKTNEDEVFFSATIPYLQKNFDAFISQYKRNPHVQLDSLTTSEEGRLVESLLIQKPENEPLYKVVLTARHHANEAMASYALEGLLESIIRGESQDEEWIRNNVGVFVVPFMDKDGVEDGDQGKNRIPRDHNRDYEGKSIYKSTAALRQKIQNCRDGSLKVALDMHCPGIRGNWHEHIYFVGSSNNKIAAEQEVFINILNKNNDGDLQLDQDKSYLKFGTSWNTKANYTQGVSCSAWMSQVEDISLAFTMELPFANNNGQLVTPESARLFGKDLAKSISIYLQTLEIK